MPLFRALAKKMAPMTNADESPTNRLTLFPIYLSLFIVSTLWCYCLFNDNRNGDDSLDFVPIHTRCPNSPPSTVGEFILVDLVGLITIPLCQRNLWNIWNCGKWICYSSKNINVVELLSNLSNLRVALI